MISIKTKYKKLNRQIKTPSIIKKILLKKQIYMKLCKSRHRIVSVVKKFKTKYIHLYKSKKTYTTLQKFQKFNWHYIRIIKNWLHAHHTIYLHYDRSVMTSLIPVPIFKKKNVSFYGAVNSKNEIKRSLSKTNS